MKPWCGAVQMLSSKFALQALVYQLWSHGTTLSLLDARPRDHGTALVTVRVLNKDVAFPRNWTLNARLSFPLASACVFSPLQIQGLRLDVYTYHSLLRCIAG